MKSKKFSRRYRTTENGKHEYKNATFVYTAQQDEDYFIQIGRYVVDLMSVKEITEDGEVKKTRLSEKVINDCLRLILVLRFHHNKVLDTTFPSQDTLERETGLEVKEIKQASDTLEALHIIKRKVKREGTKEKIYYYFPQDDKYEYREDNDDEKE